MTRHFKQCNARNFKSGRSAKIKYIVVHYTANYGDTAKNNADYFAREKVGASANYFIDEDNVWQSVMDTDTAWHCGGKMQGKRTKRGGAFHNVCTNSNSIGIEMCLLDRRGNVRQKVIDNTIEWVKLKMAEYDIPASHVIRHWEVTSKDCPAPMVGDNNALWDKFITALTNTSNHINAPTKEVDSEVVTQSKVEMNGKTYVVSVIVKNGENYIRLRDFEQAGYKIDYDANKALPSIQQPQTRKITDEIRTDLSNAIKTLKHDFNFTDSTIDYLMQYTYGDALIKRITE